MSTLPVPSAPALPPPGGDVLRLRGPADLLAALPHLLGFHPRDSAVAVELLAPAGPGAGERLGRVARVEHPAAAAGAPAAAAGLASWWAPGAP
ncbi:DUF4192 family protein, partial [Kineococcus terrestris]|uniref:DUF4192 family protein n=1 Tax=Kineococcus terrestris TaxID=2044856 RepID=UPI0034DAF6EE